MSRILESQSHRIVGVLEPERPQRPSASEVCKSGDLKIIITTTTITAAAVNSAYHVPGTFLNTFI